MEHTIFWDEAQVHLGGGYVGGAFVRTDLNDHINVEILGAGIELRIEDADTARKLAAMLDAAAGFVEGR